MEASAAGRGRRSRSAGEWEQNTIQSVTAPVQL
jgi:hypothetical protein